MVFTTAINLIRSRGPDEFWKKRRVFRLASHFIGRRRNCYRVAIKIVHRALAYATKGRELRKIDIKDLRESRITSGCEQHGLTLPELKEGLTRSSIFLNRKSLSDLAAWEPYSFKALTDIARQRLREDGLNATSSLQEPIDVITRGMR